MEIAASKSQWGLIQKIAFRFVFIYLTIYSIPFPFGYDTGSESITDAYNILWLPAVNFVGIFFFDIDKIDILPNGSGDTTF